MDDLNLLNLPTDSSDSPKYSTKQIIACCGSYRACSDAGHCINQSTETLFSCLYRKNLESGKIFYGKNATEFCMDTYHEILSMISGLSPSAKTLLDQLARFYFVDSYLSTDILIYHSSALDELLPLKFFILYQNPTALLPKFKLSYLRDHTGLPSSTYKSRSDIVKEISTNRRDLLNGIMEPFRYLDFVAAENRKYFVEAYYDGYFDTSSVDPLPLPLSTDPVFLKSK